MSHHCIILLYWSHLKFHELSITSGIQGHFEPFTKHTVLCSLWDLESCFCTYLVISLLFSFCWLAVWCFFPHVQWYVAISKVVFMLALCSQLDGFRSFLFVFGLEQSLTKCLHRSCGTLPWVLIFADELYILLYCVLLSFVYNTIFGPWGYLFH